MDTSRPSSFVVGDVWKQESAGPFAAQRKAQVRRVENRHGAQFDPRMPRVGQGILLPRSARPLLRITQVLFCGGQPVSVACCKRSSSPRRCIRAAVPRSDVSVSTNAAAVSSARSAVRSTVPASATTCKPGSLKRKPLGATMREARSSMSKCSAVSRRLPWRMTTPPVTVLVAPRVDWSCCAVRSTGSAALSVLRGNGVSGAA